MRIPIQSTGELRETLERDLSFSLSMMIYDRHHTIRENVTWGVGWGLRFAIVLGIWISIVFLIGGSAAFAKYDTSFGKALGVYLGGGALAGLIVGLFRPLLQNQVVAAIVGVLAAIPVIIMVNLTLHPGKWNGDDVFVVSILSLFYGLVMGPIFYRQAKRRRTK